MGRAASQHVASSIRGAGPFSVRVSDAPDDPDWDDFLERAPNGHHAQTSAWGRARAFIGWRPARVVVSEDGLVVAGAQMLTRPMPIGGNIGFVCRGPVVRGDRPDLARLVFDEMMAMGKRDGVQYLVVQPPRGGDWMCRELTALGFHYGAFDIDITATVLIDLQPDLDEVFAGMSKKTRHHVKEGERRGVIVRRGSEADLPIFNRLKDVQSARLGYARRSEGYYTELWRALAPRGHIELFIAEYDGEPVSAQLAIPFGDTCHHMERPWSGEHGNLRPNELIKWEVIKWAKSEGYRFADLEGIEAPVAEAVLAGKEVPDDPGYSASRFKLKFVGAGQVIIDPPSFDYVYNPLLRFAYRCIPAKVMRSRWMRTILFRFRETGS
jgi:lipid II:glycine glycyltransferase (peptidoglycan interpeptide bridge formation enzyme)